MAKTIQDQLFESAGVHTIVDGQFGSTGKGVLAAWLARESVDKWCMFDAVISNAGPNSGHTFYYGGEKVVLKQLPTFAVAQAKRGVAPTIYLTAGAVIDPAILVAEAANYPGPIFIHPNAAVTTPKDKDAEHSGTIAAVAGTRSGTGEVIARKVRRDPTAVMEYHRWASWLPHNVAISVFPIHWRTRRYFMEVSQGFSLGINQRFYPKCTSRECTVSQALADASLPPQASSKVYMSLRAHPIRVGNVDGHSSGDWYPDQVETTWEALGVPQERTTVTNRVRRVATFSVKQLCDAMYVNCPDYLFVNFLNYLGDTSSEKYIKFRHDLLLARIQPDGTPPGLIGGFGPTSGDVLFPWTP